MILLFILLIAFLYGYWHILTKRPKNFPPGPNWYPFVGSSYLLRKNLRKYGSLYSVYKHWGQKYNSPVIGFKLGKELAVVALDYESIHTIHTKEIFDGRPDNFFIRLRTMGTRLGITGCDGPVWAEHRAFTSRHLREAGYGRQPMEIALTEELTELLNIIESKSEQPIAPGTILSPSVLNVLWIFAAGKKPGRTNKSVNRLFMLLRQRSKTFDVSGGILNHMPWLRFIAPEKTGFNLIQNFNREVKSFLMEAVEEHKQDYTEEKASQDLMYAFIKEMNARDQSNTTYTEEQLVFIVLDMFIAGAETTGTTLDVGIMAMVSYPEIQKKVQKELDEVLGRNTLPKSSDRSKLPYTDAVIMEIQRFYHVLPVTGPRRVFADTTLGGYDIPKETTCFIGLQSLLMDDEYWGDPQIFRPERFLDENMKIINTERCLPFGQGRRRCLGEILARGCLFTYISGILHTFTISLPNGRKIPDRNLVPGIVLSPKPYEVVFTKRKN